MNPLNNIPITTDNKHILYRYAITDFITYFDQRIENEDDTIYEHLFIEQVMVEAGIRMYYAEWQRTSYGHHDYIDMSFDIIQTLMDRLREFTRDMDTLFTQLDTIRTELRTNHYTSDIYTPDSSIWFVDSTYSNHMGLLIKAHESSYNQALTTYVESKNFAENLEILIGTYKYKYK